MSVKTLVASLCPCPLFETVTAWKILAPAFPGLHPPLLLPCLRGAIIWEPMLVGGLRGIGSCFAFVQINKKEQCCSQPPPAWFTAHCCRRWRGLQTGEHSTVGGVGAEGCWMGAALQEARGRDAVGM